MRPRSVESCDTAVARGTELLAALEGIAAEIPIEALPGFFAGLELARWRARLRVLEGEREASGAAATAAPPALLRAEQVAGRLNISKADVYRRAKSDLRSTVVDVGPGQVRFDPAQLDRFIRSRRRG